MWCAKKPPIDEQSVIITMEMKEISQLALIRFWNYNASRVHAQIGVRHLEMYLDDVAIFRGELECAFSADSEFTPVMGETVLFTTSDHILEQIAAHDICLVNLPEEPAQGVMSLSGGAAEFFRTDHLTPYRPSTCESAKTAPPTPVDLAPPPKFGVLTAAVPVPSTATIYRRDVKVLHIELCSNWGMDGLIGLTGLEIVDEQNQIIDESKFSLTTSDGNSDQALLLFNGKNLTRNHQDMWIVDFDPKKPISISISFHSPISLKAISIWNYNASFELSYAGAKAAKIYVNGKSIMSHVLLRKATGFVYFDYVQDIFMDSNSVENSWLPPKVSSHVIGGFVFQIRLLSTWGDEFYIGLNGIELYNQKGKLIKIREHNLAAFPESVNILPNIKNDLRTSNNLITQPNDTAIAKNMWLTPLLPNRCARVFFVFDVPTYISKMVIFNYRKTPERGVRHISITVDDLIIFSGEVPQSSMETTAKLVINLNEI
uniref:DUF4457 domain-containing protein n=2 Tax=Caenorhabditis japonica TaxID=281687 RepID=A0A8R1HZ10_CAEJA